MVLLRPPSPGHLGRRRCRSPAAGLSQHSNMIPFFSLHKFGQRLFFGRHNPASGEVSDLCSGEPSL
jgi:hypothetical protein